MPNAGYSLLLSPANLCSPRQSNPPFREARLMVLRTFAFIAISAALATTTVASQNVNISDRGASSCSDIRVTYDHQPAATAEESLTIPGNVPLNITPGQNGGVNVTGYDGSQFQVTACKAARSEADLAS